MQLKHELESVKKENHFLYDDEMIRDKENEVRALEKQVSSLEKERNAFLKVRKEQGKAVDSLYNAAYSERLDKTRAQVHKLKEECKNLTNKIHSNEKVLLRNHERTVGKAKKIKDI